MPTGWRSAYLAPLLVAALPAGPASAQADPEVQGPPAPPKIIPDCRKSGSNEIVVCGKQQRSPYRLPEPPPGFDPDGGVDSVSRERNALLDVGDSGIGSCSTVGPGGSYGCTFKRWKNEEQQRQGHSSKKGLIRKFRERETPDPIPEK
jgi:hypothetical protein